MASDDEDDAPQSLHFSLHLDKALPSQVEIAAWNPEKDLLAMVSADHQLTVHRFNWQRLWAISPVKRVSSICWSPDGKALAAGYDDGEICIHDVENGETLRSIEKHRASIQCLHWAEEKQSRVQDSSLLQEDRTAKFFPPHPRPPAMPGAGSAFDIAGGLAGDGESNRENAASRHFQQHLNILCSADADGFVCLSAFGMFSIGKLKLQQLIAAGDRELSAVKMMLSSDLRCMTLLCSEGKVDGESEIVTILVDTTLISSRRNEIRQVALQAAAVEELLVVLQTTLKVMNKHWSDAISSFVEKFTGFQELISQHGRDSTPRDELLSLLACGAVSGSLHQFLAITLGEAGLKKLSKSIDAAGRELLTLTADYLQPSAEIIAFRIGELLALSRWRNQLESIGLDETLVESVMENASMLLVQVERFLHLVSQTTGQFRLFFLWLTKALRQFNSDSVLPDQTSAINSADIAVFLQSQFEYDPIGPHLSSNGVMSQATIQEDQALAEELLELGGFKNVKFLQNTLFQHLDALFESWRTALSKPVAVISPVLAFMNRVPLCQYRSQPPTALSSAYYEMPRRDSPELPPVLIDYTCFQIGAKHIGVARGFGLPPGESDAQMINEWGPEIVLLQLQDDLRCVDFALYKEKQLVLLLDDKDQAWIMVFQLDDLPFIPLTSSTNLLEFCSSNNGVSVLDASSGKARNIPQLDVISPLAVSASRGLACIFSAQRRALLYDLEEDEEKMNPNETSLAL